MTDSDRPETGDSWDRPGDLRRDIALALGKAGISGCTLMDYETARPALIASRIEVLHVLREHDVDSFRDLAARLERDEAEVCRDLAVLAEQGFIEYDDADRGKRPTVTMPYVFVGPL